MPANKIIIVLFTSLAFFKNQVVQIIYLLILLVKEFSKNLREMLQLMEI